jgi:FAD:protein FMN transferase
VTTDPTALPVLAATGDVRPAPAQPRRAWVEQIMGMPISVHVRGPLARDAGPGTPAGPESGPASSSGGPVEEVVRWAMVDLRAVDEIFSTYRAESQVSRLRRGELPLRDAHPWVRDVIALCRQARERTGGWFESDLPDETGERRFDPTGLVKGWAIERVTRDLSTALPDHDVLVNAGGDLAVRCRRTDADDWRVGIENPADRSRLLATVPLRTGGVATSGAAARGAHVIDPHSGQRIARAGSVTVIGPDLMWADVYATAGFAMGAAAPAFLAGLDDHLSFVVHPDGRSETITGRSTR